MSENRGMTIREIIIGAITLIFGIASGIAICTKTVTTPLDNFNVNLSEFYVDPLGKQKIKSSYYMDGNIGQSIIFDNSNEFKIIGIEYFIKEEKYKNLKEDDKKDWVKKEYSYRSGFLVATNHQNSDWFAKNLSNRYSKTIFLWPAELPLDKRYIDSPKEGEIGKEIIEKRDSLLKINTETMKKIRETRIK